MTGTDQPSGGESTVVSPTAGSERGAQFAGGGAVVLGVLLVVVTFLGILHVHNYTVFSPSDEIQHFDTLEKASRFVLIGRGERISQTTMREVACHGLDHPWAFDSCDAPSFDVEDFPEQGWNTAFSASPLYYGVTGIAGRILDLASPEIESLLTASRIAGLGWVLAGVVLLWMLLGEVGIRYSVRFFSIVLITTAPTVLQLSSIINPDITGLVGGAAVAWLTLRWERGASPAWLLLPVAALTVLGKPLNAAVVAAMAAYVLFRSIEQRGRAEYGSSSSPTRAISALIGGMLIGALPWTFVSNALATVSMGDVPMIARFSGPPLTLSHVVGQLTAVVSPLQDPYLPALIKGPLTVAVAAATNLYLIGTNIGVALMGRDRRWSTLSATTVAGALLLGPAVAVFVFIALDGMVVDTTMRYGMPLLPLFVVGLAVASASGRLGRATLGALSILSLTVISAELLGLM